MPEPRILVHTSDRTRPVTVLGRTLVGPMFVVHARFRALTGWTKGQVYYRGFVAVPASEVLPC